MLNTLLNIIIGFENIESISNAFNFGFLLFIKYFILFAVYMIVLSVNPIHAVLYLVLSFVLSAIFVISIGAEFLGILLIIVYVGAIAVLFLFIVMMLNIEQQEALQKNLKHYYLLSILLVLLLAKLFSYNVYGYFGILQSELFYVYTLSFSYRFESWLDYSSVLDNILVFGTLFYTYYFHLLIVSGLVLLLAMVASIVLTLIKDVENKKVLKYQDKYEQIARTTYNSVILSSWN